MSKTNLVWVLAAVCFGCTSTNDPTVASLDAGADAKKADGGTSAPPKDGGRTPGDDSGKNEEDSSTPIPCAPVSGGLPCDADKVYCGATSCDATTEDCCVDTRNGSSTCGAKGSCTGKAGLGCDEAGDCATGEVCCFSASGATPTGALCQTGPCGFGDYSQSCRSDSECAGSGQCITGSCAGYKIQTCAAIPSTACGN